MKIRSHLLSSAVWTSQPKVIRFARQRLSTILALAVAQLCGLLVAEQLLQDLAHVQQDEHGCVPSVGEEDRERDGHQCRYGLPHESGHRIEGV